MWLSPRTLNIRNRPGEWGRVSRPPAAMEVSRWRISRLQPELIKVSARDWYISRRPPEEEPVMPENTLVANTPRT